MSSYESASNSIERERIVEMISNFPTQESIGFMKAVFDRVSGKEAFEDKIRASKGLFKLAPRIAGAPVAFEEVTIWLCAQVKEGTDENDRLEAARTLAMPGQRNQAYLGELAASESDPKVKRFLLLASRQYPIE